MVEEKKKFLDRISNIHENLADCELVLNNTYTDFVSSGLETETEEFTKILEEITKLKHRSETLKVQLKKLIKEADEHFTCTSPYSYHAECDSSSSSSSSDDERVVQNQSNNNFSRGVFHGSIVATTGNGLRIVQCNNAVGGNNINAIGGKGSISCQQSNIKADGSVTGVSIGKTRTSKRLKRKAEREN